MLYVYEFELVPHGNHVVAWPFDFDGGTQGCDYREVSEMAADWLRTELAHRLMNNEPLPQATLGNLPQKGGRVLVVAVDVSLEGVSTVSAADAAKLLGVSRPRVSQMLKSGQLSGFQQGRDTRVTLDSIKARIAEKPKAGRPRKRSARVPA